MAKKTDWEKIRNEWETTDITFKALAKKYGIAEGTVKSRRSREKWSKDTTDKKDATKNEDATDSNEKDATKKNSGNKRRYRPGSRKGAGNPNPKKKFTERNSAALKHGLFSRYIPKETLEIMGTMDKDNPADLIWDQIMLQYAAIMRAQQIMFVESAGDTAKELKKLRIEYDFDDEGNQIQIPVEKEYEVQFSWDRHANFMNAQSRAISELRTSIRQFSEMTYADDERILKLEQMQASIDKTNAEIEDLSGNNKNNSAEDWTEAVKKVADKRRSNRDGRQTL